MGKHRSEDLKQNVVNFYKREQSIRKTADTYKIPRETVRRWVDREKNTGNVEYASRPEGSYKVTKQEVEFLQRRLRQKQGITLSDLLGEFKKEYPESTLSRSHLTRIIQHLNITRKNWTKKHYPETRYGRPMNYEADEAEFLRKIRAVPLESLIALDETSIQLGMVGNKARCYLGKRCHLRTNNNAIFKKYTLLLAISTQGVVGYHLLDTGVNHTILNDFLRQHVYPYQTRQTVVMDNAGAHREQSVKANLERAGHDVVFTLAYSPDLNPIENFFSQLKYYLRKENLMTKQEVIQALDKVFRQSIKSHHYQNYFINAYTIREPRNKKKSTLWKKPKKYKD